jgi:hypothetical protein
MADLKGRLANRTESCRVTMIARQIDLSGEAFVAEDWRLARERWKKYRAGLNGLRDIGGMIAMRGQVTPVPAEHG